MALSMDEQRMLAEIERRLSAEDPRLAARLTSFKRPGPAARFKSPRGKLVGSLFTVIMLAVISMMVYAMVPFRAHGPKSGSSPQASSPGFSTSAQIRPQPSAHVAKPGTPVRAATSGHASPGTSTLVKTGAAKTGAGKTAARTGAGTGAAGAPGAGTHKLSSASGATKTVGSGAGKTG